MPRQSGKVGQCRIYHPQRSSAGSFLRQKVKMRGTDRLAEVDFPRIPVFRDLRGFGSESELVVDPKEQSCKQVFRAWKFGKWKNSRVREAKTRKN